MNRLPVTLAKLLRKHAHKAGIVASVVAVTVLSTTIITKKTKTTVLV
ncbi:hypothetical protein [Leeia oryzae]|nr:hypothetical protein [Leeia oryzae]